MIDHVLLLISNSWWSDNLLLRGSYPLQAWLGDRAREPADLDWVFLRGRYSLIDDSQYGVRIDAERMWPEVVSQMTPGDLGMWNARNTPGATGWLEAIEAVDEDAWDVMFGDLLAQIRRQPMVAGSVFLDAAAAYLDRDGMSWEYEDWGVRLIVPWRAPGMPHGRVSLDFSVADPPEDLLDVAWFPIGVNQRFAVAQVPSRGLSLAWKIKWLRDESASDDGARGKDLYDAVLLAEDEQTKLSNTALERWHAAKHFDPAEIRDWTVAWADFQAEYPWVQGSVEDWKDRLSAALISLFATAAAPADPDANA